MARILIIEDEDVVREMVRDMLERAGHQVVEAPDGEKGIALYRAEPTDLIITDLIMPKKEGVETIMELREQFPDVKIIAVSGGGRIGPTDYLEIARRIGAARTFKKPFDRRELLKAVSELVEG